MAYQSTKPAAGDRLRVSQGDIQTNFADIKTAFDVNHVALTGAGTPEGKHFKLDMTNQSAAIPTATAPDITFFNSIGLTLTSQQNLFYRREGVAAIPITEGLPNVLETTSGWYRFPSGTLVKWGQVPVDVSVGSGNTGTARDLTFPVAGNIPVFATAPFVMTDIVRNSWSGPTYVLAPGTTILKATLYTNATSNPTIAFLAIGT